MREARASLLSVVAALVLGFIAIALTAASVETAVRAYAGMLWGGLGDFPRLMAGGDFTALSRPWGEASTRAGLLLCTGLSVGVAFTVGLFNIGAQGQLLVGAIIAAAIGARALPSGLYLPLCLLGAAAGGAAYALIPAGLKLWRGVHEVISTIMLNWVAAALIEGWLVVGPLKARSSGGTSISGTDEIAAAAMLPRLLGDSSRLHAGFLLAVGLALALAFWRDRTRHGFETRAVGLSADAARAAGIPVGRRMAEAMAISGALAGLGGALLVLGTEHKFPATLGGSYGFDGIAIALIGQNQPLGALAAALFFGVLRAGGTRMQLVGVHASFPELIQGFALLGVAARLGWGKRRVSPAAGSVR